MAKIPVTGGFVLIPEGTYVFRIYDVEYDETYGKMIVKMVNAKGLTHQERFSLKNKDESFNEKALNAFSYFAKTALNDFSIEEIDHEALVGHYIKAEVKHSTFPNRNEPEKTVTFANLGDKSPADKFDEPATERALTLGRSEEKKVDLNSLLED